jgi:hypothetical protein
MSMSMSGVRAYDHDRVYVHACVDVCVHFRVYVRVHIHIQVLAAWTRPCSLVMEMQAGHVHAA